MLKMPWREASIQSSFTAATRWFTTNSRWYRGIFLPFFLPCSSLLLLLARAGADNVLENEGTKTNDACTFLFNGGVYLYIVKRQKTCPFVTDGFLVVGERERDACSET
jgi:hypothetical protein